jgi:uncharacterized membrane protein
MSFLVRCSSSLQLHSPVRSKALRVVAALALVLSASACGGEDDAESEPTTSVSYCDVQPVIGARCLRCHTDPPENFAPMPLTSFDAIHANYPSDTKRPLYQLMHQWVSTGSMPPAPDFNDLVPPVDQLTESEKSLLLDWLSGGAPRGAGCTLP